ncbi:MAG: DUF2855 family protein [Leptospiraceae bacterium]|nr:DUF2855 family protein [Leptospiraceae bacterium]
MTHSQLLVSKTDITQTRTRSIDDIALAEGQIRVSVNRFAFTANNITYAAFGDVMHYWDFFPTGEDGWGIVPVWGFADVVQTSHPGVAVGERLYGYFPMAEQCVLQPDRLTPAGFRDAAAHRSSLHAVYNQYQRVASAPFYTAESEDLQALLRPLFITSWLIDDFLADKHFFGAAADPARPAVMLLSSASSKTAYGTAFMLAQRKGIDVVGLTSTSNVAFCESLGCYHRVLNYEQLDQLAADTPCIYIDFAGNAAMRSAVHHRFAHLAYSCSIGGTHVSELGGARDLPGPKATLFFAPAQIKKRQGEWGVDGLGTRWVQGWRGFLARVSDTQAPWIDVQRHGGTDVLATVYRQVLQGKGDPRQGHIVQLRD